MSLTDAEKSLLVKGLSFALPPKQLSYSDYLINFELFYRSIDNLKILSGDNLDFIKTRIKDTALTSFRNYNTNAPQHLSNEEFEALKTLSKNCNLVIQKADKGNSVVIVEKDVYLRHMETIMKLSSITSNEFAVEDSFAFAEKIVHQESKLFMGSLDVYSLFTNIPFEEAINRGHP